MVPFAARSTLPGLGSAHFRITTEHAGG